MKRGPMLGFAALVGMVVAASRLLAQSDAPRYQTAPRAIVDVMDVSLLKTPFSLRLSMLRPNGGHAATT
jgi:hypothetical protein